jgi:transcriptional regulator with XRE-family HTH domain
MANFLIIRNLCDKKKITIRELAMEVGMRDISVHQLIKKGKTNTETIEKIAEILDVPVGIFFDETPLNTIKQNVKGNRDTAASIYGNATISNCESKLEIAQKEIAHLTKLVEEKERTIQILMNKN